MENVFETNEELFDKVLKKLGQEILERDAQDDDYANLIRVYKDIQIVALDRQKHEDEEISKLAKASRDTARDERDFELKDRELKIKESEMEFKKSAEVVELTQHSATYKINKILAIAKIGDAILNFIHGEHDSFNAMEIAAWTLEQEREGSTRSKLFNYIIGRMRK